MGITFAQPGPFAPGIASAYGSAEQWSKDIPQMNSLAQSVASHQQAAAQLQTQAALQQSAQSSANANAAANRTQQGNQFNASLDEQANEQQAQIASRQYLASQAAQQQIVQANQQAELQNWLSQQDLTQKENLRLQQIQNGIADTVAAGPDGTGVLTKDQVNETLYALKTTAQPLQARKELAQQKLEASRQKQIDQEIQQNAAHQATADKMNSMTLEDKVKYRPDENILAQVEADTDPVDSSLTGIQRVAAEAIRKREVMAEVAQRGGLVPWIMKKDGTFDQGKPHEQKADHMEDKKQAQEMKDWHDEMKTIAHNWSTYQSALSHEAKTVKDEPANFDKSPEEILEIAKKRVLIPVPPAYPAKPTFEGKSKKGGAAAPPPAETPAATPAPKPTSDSPVPPSAQSAPLEEQKPFKPGEHESMSPQQRSIVGALSEKLQEVEKRAIPEEKKKEIVDAIHGTHALLAKYGWIVKPGTDELNPAIDKTGREEVAKFKRIVQSIPATIPNRVSQPAQNKVEEHLNFGRFVLPGRAMP